MGVFISMIEIILTFYKFFAKRKFLFASFLFITILSSVASSINPYFFKLFVDAIPALNYEVLLKILVFFIAARLTAVGIRTLAHQVGDYIVKDSAPNARLAVFQHIQDLDFAFHSNKSTGFLISAIKRGEGAFFSIYHNIHFRILRTIVTFFVMLYFFSSISFSIIILAVISFLFSLLVARFTVNYNIIARKKFVDEEDKVSAVIVDNMINYDTVKLFAKEEWELSRLEKTFKPWKRAFWKYVVSFRIFDGSNGILVNASMFLILLVTIKQAVNQEISVGDFVLIASFLQIFYNQITDLMWSFRDIAKAYADISRYFGILDYIIEIKDPKNPVPVKNIDGEVDFNRISFSYKDGKKNAVKKLDLHIRQGQSIALVGRSGSGKTTLAKLLMRFYDVDKGEIKIDNINIKNFSKSDLRSFMGVVPQEPILFNNSIEYNIGYGNSKTVGKEIKAATKMANLHKFIESLPKKYRTQVGERGIKLSGGQKQRLAIARMILSDPDIIIFDEATSQLDSENEKLVADAFWKVAKNKTTIIIAHRLSTAKRADKIVIMEEGKIVETGSHQELVNKKDSLYKYFWDLQVNVD